MVLKQQSSLVLIFVVAICLLLAPATAVQAADGAVVDGAATLHWEPAPGVTARGVSMDPDGSR